MGLEAATFIHQLNPANPVGAVDPKAQGDDHIRMLKATIQATFVGITGAVTVTHTILNQWAGLAAAYNWGGQHRHIDGNVGAPAFSFVSDPDTGWFRNGSGNIRFSSDGNLRLDISNVQFRPVGIPILPDDGAVGAPIYSFSNDPDTGIYRQGANDMRLVSGGVARLIVTDTGNYARVTLGLPDGTIGVPGLSFENDPDTGLYRISANVMGITVGGVLVAQGTTGGIGQFQVVNGNLATPGLSFVGDNNTGWFLNGVGDLRASCSGTLVFQADANLMQSLRKHYFIDGTNAIPAITFSSDTDTGLYKIGSDALGFTEGGSGFRIGFRSVPRSTTATTLAIGDVGKCVAISAAINIPASVFSAGDCLSIYNDSAASVNITTSAGTLRLAGTTTTGTRSLAARGMATLWFNVGGATPEVIASGPGVA